MSDRHAFRTKWYDYNEGTFFITICAHQKQYIFGVIENQTFIPSELGGLISEQFQQIPQLHEDAKLWSYVVMPNHIHLVLTVSTVGTRLFASALNGSDSIASTLNSSDSIASALNGTDGIASTRLCETTSRKLGCLKPPKHDEPVADFHHNSRLATIIGAFKAGVTRSVRTRKIASLPCWQSRYHEHIIRDQRAYENITNYINNNVANWQHDCFYHR